MTDPETMNTPRETEALDRWPELRPFVREVVARYGDRLHAVLLYGSRARGEEREDSDYDLALLLDGTFSHHEEVGALADLNYNDFVERGLHIQARPVAPARIAAPPGEDYYARNVAIDGVALLGRKP